VLARGPVSYTFALLTVRNSLVEKLKAVLLLLLLVNNAIVQGCSGYCCGQLGSTIAAAEKRDLQKQGPQQQQQQQRSSSSHSSSSRVGGAAAAVTNQLSEQPPALLLKAEVVWLPLREPVSRRCWCKMYAAPRHCYKAL
jgi:hypothetical protein